MQLSNRTLPTPNLRGVFLEFYLENWKFSKSIKQTVLESILVFVLKTIFYYIYKYAIKENRLEEFEALMETKFLKLLKEKKVESKEDLIKVAEFLAPFWSRKLKKILIETAEEAYLTYLLSQKLEKNNEILKNFIEKLN